MLELLPFVQLREAARLAAQRARQRLVEAAQRQQQQEAAATAAGGNVNAGGVRGGQYAHDSLLSDYQNQVEAIFEMMDRRDRLDIHIFCLVTQVPFSSLIYRIARITNIRCPRGARGSK